MPPTIHVNRNPVAWIGLGAALSGVLLFAWLLFGPQVTLITVSAVKFLPTADGGTWQTAFLLADRLEAEPDVGLSGETLNQLYRRSGEAPTALTPGDYVLRRAGRQWRPAASFAPGDMKLTFSADRRMVTEYDLTDGTARLPVPLLTVHWDYPDGDVQMNQTMAPSDRWLYQAWRLERVPEFYRHYPVLYRHRVWLPGGLAILILAGWGVYRFMRN